MRARAPWITTLMLAGGARVLAACADDTQTTPMSARDGGHDAAERDAGHDAAVAASTPLPAAVEAVIAQRCRKCHGKQTDHGAPFSLLDWQSTQKLVPGNPTHLHIDDAIKMRINDPNFPMPPDGNPFTDSDRETLNAWLDAGAPPAS